MTEVKTNSGIECNVNERVAEDARFSYYATKAANENALEVDRSNAVFKMIEMLLGTEKDMLEFMDRLADINGGVCDTEKMMLEISEIMEKIGAKKS